MLTFIIGLQSDRPPDWTMATTKSPSVPMTVPRGPFFEAMLQGHWIWLTSQMRLMPLPCMN